MSFPTYTYVELIKRVDLYGRIGDESIFRLIIVVGILKEKPVEGHGWMGVPIMIELMLYLIKTDEN